MWHSTGRHQEQTQTHSYKTKTRFVFITSTSGESLKQYPGRGTQVEIQMHLIIYNTIQGPPITATFAVATPLHLVGTCTPNAVTTAPKVWQGGWSLSEPAEQGKWGGCTETGERGRIQRWQQHSRDTVSISSKCLSLQ